LMIGGGLTVGGLTIGDGGSGSVGLGSGDSDGSDGRTGLAGCGMPPPADDGPAPAGGLVVTTSVAVTAIANAPPVYHFGWFIPSSRSGSAHRFLFVYLPSRLIRNTEQYGAHDRRRRRRVGVRKSGSPGSQTTGTTSTPDEDASRACGGASGSRRPPGRVLSYRDEVLP
jgi:hypothetical protein